MWIYLQELSVCFSWRHSRYAAYTWWCHQMETFSALLAICVGNSPVTGGWRGDLTFSSICARLKGWVNNLEAGDWRRHRAHYGITVMNLKMCFDTLHQDCEDAVGTFYIYWHSLSVICLCTGDCFYRQLNHAITPSWKHCLQNDDHFSLA